MAALFALIDRHGVGGLVIGLPLRARRRRRPAHPVGRANSPATCWRCATCRSRFWDERLSTAAVKREMIDADMTRKRRAEIVDKVAAAYILQGCLDAIGRG